jgi:hypothetical protein
VHLVIGCSTQEHNTNQSVGGLPHTVHAAARHGCIQQLHVLQAAAGCLVELLANSICIVHTQQQLLCTQGEGKRCSKHTHAGAHRATSLSSSVCAVTSTPCRGSPPLTWQACSPDCHHEGAMS